MSRLTRRGKPLSSYVRDPGSIWIDAHRATLPNNEWVAANASGMVAHDPSIDGLMDQLRSRRVQPAEVTITYHSTDPV